MAEERPLWFIIPRKFCFSSMHANCVRVHPSFSLSRLTEQSPALALVGSSLPSFALFVRRHLSKWLTASFIIRLSAFLHFYPKLSRCLLFPERIRMVTIRSWKTSMGESLSRCRQFDNHSTVCLAIKDGPRLEVSNKLKTTRRGSMNDEVRARSQAAIEKKRKRKDSCHLYNYRLF